MTRTAPAGTRRSTGGPVGCLEDDARRGQPRNGSQVECAVGSADHALLEAARFSRIAERRRQRELRSAGDLRAGQRATGRVRDPTEHVHGFGDQQLAVGAPRAAALAPLAQQRPRVVVHGQRGGLFRDQELERAVGARDGGQVAGRSPRSGARAGLREADGKSGHGLALEVDGAAEDARPRVGVDLVLRAGVAVPNRLAALGEIRRAHVAAESRAGRRGADAPVGKGSLGCALLGADHEQETRQGEEEEVDHGSQGHAGDGRRGHLRA